MIWTRSSPLPSVAWHLYCIERQCLFCNTATTAVLRKAIKGTDYCQKSRKLLDVLLAANRWTKGVIRAFCIAGSFLCPVFISGLERLRNMEKVCLPSAVGSSHKYWWAVEELFVVWS